MSSIQNLRTLVEKISTNICTTTTSSFEPVFRIKIFEQEAHFFCVYNVLRILAFNFYFGINILMSCSIGTLRSTWSGLIKFFSFNSLSFAGVSTILNSTIKLILVGIPTNISQQNLNLKWNLWRELTFYQSKHLVGLLCVRKVLLLIHWLQVFWCQNWIEVMTIQVNFKIGLCQQVFWNLKLFKSRLYFRYVCIIT